MLVAVLVTFGIMTKNNEVTAFKACGVSLYRLAVPVLMVSMLFERGAVRLRFLLRAAGQRQAGRAAQRDQGQAPQTYLRPDRKWIFGNGSRIFYYKSSTATRT